MARNTSLLHPGWLQDEACILPTTQYAFGLDDSSNLARFARVKAKAALSPFEVFQALQTQEQALEFLERVRWQGQPSCPYCESKSVGRHASSDRARHRWQCWTCTKTFSVTVGTIFQGTHVPLRNLLMVLALTLASKHTPSAYTVSKDLQMRRPTVSTFMRKIRTVMVGDKAQEKFLRRILSDASESFSSKPVIV